MTDTIRVWTRAELEKAVEQDPNERSMLRVSISPRLLLLLLEYQEDKGADRCEMLSAYGDPERVELRFFRRDVP
jgi:hypothetical protein